MASIEGSAVQYVHSDRPLTQMMLLNLYDGCGEHCDDLQKRADEGDENARMYLEENADLYKRCAGIPYHLRHAVRSALEPLVQKKLSKKNP